MNFDDILWLPSFKTQLIYVISIEEDVDRYIDSKTCFEDRSPKMHNPRIEPIWTQLLSDFGVLPQEPPKLPKTPYEMAPSSQFQVR